MNGKRYEWKRFWCPRGGSLNFSDGGFLVDPDSEYSKYYKQDVFPYEKITEKPCIILLGEPGIGKSNEIRNAMHLTEELLNLRGENLLYLNLNQYTNETRLIRDLFEASLLSKKKQENIPFFIFLDSLDECKLRIDTVSEILSQKFEEYYYENLYLRIACRTSEWSNYLESNLISIWNEKEVVVYELAPLRRKDVDIAIKQNGIDSPSFYEQVYEKDVQPLAMKPITLNFLIKIFSNSYTFPNTRKELFEKGINLLIEESNPSRKESLLNTNIPTNHKLVTAERIAAMMAFCNKSTILMTSSEIEIGTGDIPIEEMVGGIEKLDPQGCEINEKLIREVISTGLFTLRGKNKMGWTHQTYMECLAAKYIFRNQLSEAQIFSLILSSSFNESKIIPQLNEVVGWLVNYIPSLFKKLMDLDPEVLLKSDVTLQDENDKERLVNNLLLLFDEQKLFDLNFSMNKYYYKLKHNRLSSQLRPFIVNKTKNWLIRHEAIDIAEACSLKDLQDDLLSVFSDENDVLFTRTNAGWALSKVIDDKHKQQLRKILFEDLSCDVNDEIKGILLTTLWPQHLTAKELFSFLETPKNPNFIGGYAGFIRRHIMDYLQVKDLPVALDWVSEQKSIRGWDMHSMEELIDSIMYLGWQNLERDGVLGNYIRAIKHLLKGYREIISRNTNHIFYDELSKQNRKRRLLVKSIFDSFTDPINEIEIFYGVGKQLISTNDFEWLLEEILVEGDENRQRALAILARIYFDISDPTKRELLIVKANQSQIVFSEFSFLLEPLDIDSEKANKEKVRYYKYYKPNRFDEKRTLFKLAWQESIIKLIDELKKGSLESYWRIHLELCKDPEQKNHFVEIESDLTILPGWKNLETNNQQEIIEASKIYLLKMDPQNDEWLGKDVLHRPAIAGYRAIRLLTNYNIVFIEQLNHEILRKWAPIIVSYPISFGFEEDQYHDKILEFFYQQVPDQVLMVFKIILNKECEKDEFISITRRFDKCWDEKIAEIVFEKIKDKKTKPNSFSSLIEELFKHKYTPVEEYLLTLLVGHSSCDKEALQRMYLGCSQMIVHSDNLHWKILWPIIQNNSEFGEELIQQLSHDRNEAGRFLNKFMENEIAGLFVWMVQHFPYSEEKLISGAHFVDRREQVGYFRDQLINVLKSRGTLEAKVAIETIKNKLPNLDWLNRVLYETKVISRIKAWNPPTSSDIKILVGQSDKRFIKSQDELMRLVIESLKRLEEEMHGALPSVKYLWEKNETQPKYENDLSDFIVLHLRRDLKNVLVNREVEIRPTRGKIKGEEPDILVQTFKRDSSGTQYEALSLIIETKCCWHNEFLVAMETQLKERYLKNNDCKYGLYLGGWYLCDSWDTKDNKCNQTKRLNKTLEEIKEYFNNQATSLSCDGNFIKSIVLDCRIT